MSWLEASAPRPRPGLRLLASLVLLVLALAAPFALADLGDVLALVVALALVATLAGAAIVLARVGGPEVRTTAAAAVLAFGTACGGFLAALAVDEAAGLCGGREPAQAASWILAGAAYLGIGTWGLRGGRRAVWAWPLAALAAIALSLAAAAILPGGRGACS